ncbi:GPI-anchored wall transfer protein 1 [Cyphellophora attinorum]|uniref:GPI-anchored wall transfer protein n=1 Tax=Cyphellophora attinorum TaxID=1664694 RepID=A0A0N1NZ11_9EURO|nr:GPI-anchored wall transfer protein 1 [Phialophora attinorum]KPI41140.1 GPI-anchored wall transfer protein 1 [Phialophora attinorum]
MAGPGEAAARLAGDYKARKEAFVSNLSGSSITEINIVTSVVPAAILLWTALQRSQSFFTPYSPLAFAVDFLLNVCAVLFAFTIYSSAPLALSVFLVAPAVLLLTLQSPKEAAPNGTAKKGKSEGADTQSFKSKLVPRPFLTHYRGTMMIMTVVAILAVDFPIFPRRFAKVETWGTSLMDIGVGSFVFAAGVVSARELYKSSDAAKPSLAMRLVQSLRHSVPLLLLGIIRLISVKGVDYAEHVTEYGVHWNFFFTLGCLPPFVVLADAVAFLHSKFPPATYALVAFAISAVYELLLNETRLLAFILTAPRVDLLSQNREGIFSFIGYLAIYLNGRSTGADILPYRIPPKAREMLKRGAPQVCVERSHIFFSLAFLTGINIVVYLLATSYYGFNIRPSRRLANLPYVYWIGAFNTFQIGVFAFIESLGPAFSYREGPEDRQSLKKATSKVLAVFNSNGLVVFLVANLLTGVVNLSVNTLDMGSLPAMAVLITYAAAVTGVAMTMDHTGIKIRL